MISYKTVTPGYKKSGTHVKILFRLWKYGETHPESCSLIGIAPLHEGWTSKENVHTRAKVFDSV